MSDQVLLILLGVFATPVIGALIWKMQQDHKAGVERDKEQRAELSAGRAEMTSVVRANTEALTSLSGVIASQSSTLSDLHEGQREIREAIDAIPRPVSGDDETPVQHRRWRTGNKE